MLFGKSSAPLRIRTRITEASLKPISGMPWGLACVHCFLAVGNDVRVQINLQLFYTFGRWEDTKIWSDEEEINIGLLVLIVQAK